MPERTGLLAGASRGRDVSDGLGDGPFMKRAGASGDEFEEDILAGHRRCSHGTSSEDSLHGQRASSLSWNYSRWRSAKS